MAASSSSAANARRQVGKYLVEQAGYSKKSETKFYKPGDDILTHVHLQRSRRITQLYVGIVPLYIPDSLYILYATNLTTKLPISTLLEDDNTYRATAWAEGVIKYLNSGILAFMESLSSPQTLLDYLENHSAIDHRFVLSPYERDQLIIFSAAYLGKVPFAVKYAKAAQQRIKEERIDNLTENLARWDEEIAKLRRKLALSWGKTRKDYEEQIGTFERNKELATLNAERSAPNIIQKYGKWIEPFVVPGFNCEDYFSQIVDNNKTCLNYEKLFSNGMNKLG